MTNTDNVNHPAHYESSRIVIEPIDLCECFDFCIGNALKYLLRAGKKEGNSEEQDLAKARWYLKRALNRKNRPDVYRHNGSKNTRLVGCAVYGYGATNEYIETLFSLGGLNINFDFPSIKLIDIHKCIKLINSHIGEEK